LYDLTVLASSKDPKAMPAFVGSHPDFQHFLGWVKTAPWTGSYAEERYNSINAFLFTDASGTDHAVRWSLVPTETVTPVTPDDLAKLGPDFLEQEIQQRVGNHPVKWTLVVTEANPGDQTIDPNQPWPEDRKSVQLGTLTISKIETEPDGPCRDIVFDPTILPDGIRPSDDPFPAARSAVYQESFNRREAEADKYPTSGGAKP
jgi:catalase